MANIHADPEKLRQLASALTAAAQQCDQLSRQLIRGLEATDWKDSERTKFESSLKGVVRLLQKAGEQMKSDLAPQLQRQARALEQFRS